MSDELVIDLLANPSHIKSELDHLRNRLKEAEALLSRAHPGMHTCETGQWFTDRDAFLKGVKP